jgi:leucyl aminopeptidase
MKIKSKIKNAIFGFDLNSWVLGALGEKPTGKTARAYIFSGKSPKIPKEYAPHLKSWQKSAYDKKPHALQVFDADEGPLYFIAPVLASGDVEGDAQLKQSTRARYRDWLGHLLIACERNEVESLEIVFESNNKEDVLAGIMGLEIASYKFKRARKGESLKMALKVSAKKQVWTAKTAAPGAQMGVAVNLARHLTNLPANELNPETYADAVKTIFAGSAVKVNVWGEAELKKQKCNLHLAVGMGADTPPALVHMKYRGRGAKGKPVAVVGKGITFDTGGVDIKPASGMRIMKKDMGGSAAVVGLMYWAMATGAKLSLDSYLALAENSVDGKSFRPGDIFDSRSGQSVEIHNTDAEGRLVLADAMDVAVTKTGADAPHMLIDIATLTGAIKGALGASLIGLFSNDAKVSRAVHSAGQDAGELVWPMPLYQKYRSQLNSHYADVANCSDGFGGAITAALFLEHYAQKLPWAHLDIYAWKDSAEGAWAEGGGSGQGVQLLAEFLLQS